MYKKQKGGVIVEFALVLPFFAYLFLVLIYIGMWMHDVGAINEAARIGVRRASYVKPLKPDEPLNDDKYLSIRGETRQIAYNMLVLYYDATSVESYNKNGYVEFRVTGNLSADVKNSIIGKIIPAQVVGNAVMVIEQ